MQITNIMTLCLCECHLNKCKYNKEVHVKMREGQPFASCNCRCIKCK